VEGYDAAGNPLVQGVVSSVGIAVSVSAHRAARRLEEALAHELAQCYADGLTPDDTEPIRARLEQVRAEHDR